MTAIFVENKNLWTKVLLQLSERKMTINESKSISFAKITFLGFKMSSAKGIKPDHKLVEKIKNER